VYENAAMNSTTGASDSTAARLRRPQFVELDRAPVREVREELVRGLRAQPAAIAPKFFYDTLGSRLFEAICELPEYYPTRTEAAIFAHRGAEVGAACGQGRTLIDLGAGDCEKAAKLLPLLKPAQYVAVDISADYLLGRLERLQDRNPQLDIVGVGLDFTHRLDLPAQVRTERRLFFYPGSSIGNFTPDEALVFLKRVRDAAGEQGALLIGVDLVKDIGVLERAYDDALQVTAAFNLNALLHVNRLLDTDFDVRDWRHVAFFNQRASRIEMHLEARWPLVVRLPDGPLHFDAGQRIHTENSYKYTLPAIEALLQRVGFVRRAVWMDPREYFAVILAAP
jgi:dimethylhistidine N-methyltransferase